MKNWKLILAGLLTFIASILGGGYSGSVMAEQKTAEALPAESYGVAYSDANDFPNAKTVADYEVKVYWGLEVKNEGQPGLPELKFQIPYYSEHTIRIADGITDDKVRAALKDKAPFRNSNFLFVWDHKIIRWVKRDTNTGEKPTGPATE